MTVKMLKAMIEATQEVPTKKQELDFGGRTLESRWTLKTAGLKDGRRKQHFPLAQVSVCKRARARERFHPFEPL